MAQTLEELKALVAANALNLVPGSLRIENEWVFFSIQELYLFKVHAQPYHAGQILEIVTGVGQTLYTPEEYATFLRCEEE